MKQMDEFNLPDISVVIPVYGAEEYLLECLDSITTNTTKYSLEVIAINDGSPDNSLKILKEYATSHSEVIVLSHKNRGGASTINRGLQLARGKYVMIIDCDDMIPSGTLDLLFEQALKNSADIVAGKILKKSKVLSEIAYDTRYITKKENTSINAKPSLFQDGMYLGKLFRKNLLINNNIFMDPKLLYADRPFVNTAQAVAQRILLLPQTTYYWRQRDSNTNLSITDKMDSICHLEDRIYSIIVICEELKSRNKSHFIPIIDEHNLKRIFWHFKTISRKPNALKKFSKACAPYVSTVQLDKIKNLTEYQKNICRLIQKHNPILFPFLYYIYITRKSIKSSTRTGYKKITRLKLTQLLKRNELGQFEKTAKLVSNDQSLIVFESFFGKSYSGNPRYIYEALLRSNRHFRAVWVFQGKKFNIPGQVVQVHRGTDEYFRYIAKATYLVNNITFSLDYKPEYTTYLQTWHGTPLKRLGLDIDIEEGPELEARETLLKEAEKWDFLIAANTFSKEKFRSAFNYKGTVLTEGYPANDLFKHPEKTQIGNVLKKRLGIPKDKKIILYAPTWRDNNRQTGWNFGFDLNLNLAKLRKKLGNEYVLLLRMHHLISDKMETSKFQGFVLDVSKYDDAHELLLITDILITDYSSIFFDYANLNRPMIFYSYDVEQYDSELRGFYINPRTELPGPVVLNEDDLISSIKSIEKLEGYYAEKREQFIETFCSLDNGRSAESIVDKVFTKLPIIDGSEKSTFSKDNSFDFSLSSNQTLYLNSVSTNIAKNNAFLEKAIANTSMNESLIVFESYFGQTQSGEPKYLYDALEKTSKQYTPVWVYQGKNKHNLPASVRQVKRGTTEYYDCLASARYWVNNIKFSITEKPSYTTYIQTWHDTPLKCIGIDIENEDSIDFTSHHDFLCETKNWDIMLSSGSYATERYRNGLGYYGEISVGLPSSAALSKNNNKKSIQKIKQRLGIPIVKKVILYAPTYRETHKVQDKWDFKQDLNLDFAQLQQHLSSDYVLLTKLHNQASRSIVLSQYEGFVYDVTNFSNIQELQVISDILITDYSSIIFEFANLERPILFFQHDAKQYAQFRGIYLDAEKSLPGPIIKTFKGLLNSLENIDREKQEHSQAIKKFKEKYCSTLDSLQVSELTLKLFSGLPNRPVPIVKKEPGTYSSYSQ